MQSKRLRLTGNVAGTAKTKYVGNLDRNTSEKAVNSRAQKFPVRSQKASSLPSGSHKAQILPSGPQRAESLPSGPQKADSLPSGPQRTEGLPLQPQKGIEFACRVQKALALRHQKDRVSCRTSLSTGFCLHDLRKQKVSLYLGTTEFAYRAPDSIEFACRTSKSRQHTFWTSKVEALIIVTAGIKSGPGVA